MSTSAGNQSSGGVDQTDAGGTGGGGGGGGGNFKPKDWMIIEDGFSYIPWKPSYIPIHL